MIKSFRCADTQALFETGKSKRFAAIAKVATRKLVQLDAAALSADIALQRALGGGFEDSPVNNPKLTYTP